MAPTSENERRTYPLALLFVVLTCAAILAAAAGPLFRAIDWSDGFGGLLELVLAAVAAGLAGGALGALIGLYHFQRLNGVLCGLAVGAVLGPLAGMLMTTGAASLSSVAPAVLIGSVILLFVGSLIRPVQRVVNDEEIVNATLAEQRKESQP